MAAACVSDDRADMTPPLAVTGISPGSGAPGCVLGDVLGARGVCSTVRSEYSAARSEYPTARSEYPTARSVHFLGPLAPGRRGPLGIVAGAFVHGKNIDLPAGTTLYIQTQSDTTVYGVQTTYDSATPFQAVAASSSHSGDNDTSVYNDKV